MSRLVRIIANPISGRRSSLPLRNALADALRRRGLTPEICLTEGPGHAATLAAVDPNVHAGVVIVGGDGTIRSAIEGLTGRPTPMAICPTGTENLSAKYFGFSANTDAVADVVAGGKVRRVDVGFANGRPFLAVTGFGFDAEAVRRLELARRGHISYATYFLPIWRTFAGHRFPVLRVEADGMPCCDEPAMVFVGNIPRYALGLRLLREARCDDGKLDVCIFRCRSRWQLLAHAWRTAWATHVESPGVIYRQARHIRVQAAQPVPYEMDGDDAGDVSLDKSVELTISSEALNIFDTR